MAALLVFMLTFSMALHSSSATWCVCKKGGSEKVYQEAIDYACGNGADCTLTHEGGPCFSPDTPIDHCSYAVNSFFQAKAQAPGSCDFAGVATATTTDPSSNGCTYPSSASGTTSTNAPGAPGSTTTSNGNILGGGSGIGLGPSGVGINTDVSHGGLRLHQETNIFCFMVSLVSLKFLMFL